MDKENVMLICDIYICHILFFDIYNTRTMKYYSAIKKKEILPFATVWMGLKVIMLSEISQRKTNTV